MIHDIPRSFMNIVVVAGLVCLLCTPGRRASAQGRKPVSERASLSTGSKTKVEVKNGSGDFETWGDSLVISSPETVTLRWSTDEDGVASAMFQVREEYLSLGQTNRTNVNTVYKGNLNTVPTKGHVALFDVLTKIFVTNTPPLSPKRYYVHVIPKDSQGNAIGLPSPAVTIIYKQSSQDIPQLGSEYCHLSPRSTYSSERCALRLFGFDKFDAPNNRVDSSLPTKPVEILIKAAEGKKFQIDCNFTSSGKQPYKASGPVLYQITPNGGDTHVVFTYESKNPYWVSIYLKTEDQYSFYGCVVTNLK